MSPIFKEMEEVYHKWFCKTIYHQNIIKLIRSHVQNEEALVRIEYVAPNESWIAKKTSILIIK